MDLQSVVLGCTAQVLILYGVANVKDGKVNVCVVNDRQYPVIVAQSMCLARLGSMSKFLAPVNPSLQDAVTFNKGNESSPQVAVIN